MVGDNENSIKVSNIDISVCVADYGRHDHVSRHVDLQLDNVQAAALKRAFVGLDAAGARLANGQRLRYNVDVVRYLLEQIAANS